MPSPTTADRGRGRTGAGRGWQGAIAVGTRRWRLLAARGWALVQPHFRAAVQLQAPSFITPAHLEAVRLGAGGPKGLKLEVLGRQLKQAAAVGDDRPAGQGRGGMEEGATLAAQVVTSGAPGCVQSTLALVNCQCVDHSLWHSGAIPAAHPSLWHSDCMDARPASTRQPPLKARKKASTHTRPATFSPLDAICEAVAVGRWKVNRWRRRRGQGRQGGRW